MIIRKSSLYEESNDHLVFCARGIQKVKKNKTKQNKNKKKHLCILLLWMQPLSNFKMIQKFKRLAKNHSMEHHLRRLKILPEVTIIEEKAFHICDRHLEVEISKDSKVNQPICEIAFAECIDLRNVDIPNDSLLQTINDYSFYNPSIESFN